MSASGGQISVDIVLAQFDSFKQKVNQTVANLNSVKFSGENASRSIVSLDRSMMSAGQKTQTLASNVSTADMKLKSTKSTLDQTKSSSDQLSTAVDKTGNEFTELGNKSKNASGNLQQFQTRTRDAALAATGFATSLFNTYLQYDSIKDQEISLARTRERLDQKTDDLADREKKLREEYANGDKTREEYEQGLEEIKEGYSMLEIQEEQYADSFEDHQNAWKSFAFSMLPTVITGISTLSLAMPKLSSGLKTATISAKLFGGGMSGMLGRFTPIGIAIAAIAGAFYALKTNMFGVRTAITNFGKWLGQTFPILKPFLNLIQGIGAYLGIEGLGSPDVKNSLDQLRGQFEFFATEITGWVHGAGVVFGDFLTKISGGDIFGAIGVLQQGLMNAGAEMRDFLAVIMPSWVIGGIDQLGDHWNKGWQSLLSGDLKWAIQETVNGIIALINSFGYGLLGDSFEPYSKGLSDFAFGFYEFLTNIFKGDWSAAFGQIWSAIQTGLFAVWDWANVAWETYLLPALEAIGKWFGDIKWDVVWDGIVEGFGKIWDWGKFVWEDILKPALEGIAKWFTDTDWNAVWEGIKAGWFNLVNWTTYWGKFIWDEYLQPAIDGIKNWFFDTDWTEVGNTIVKSMIGAVKWVVELGGQTFNLLAAVVGSFVDNLVQSAKDYVGWQKVGETIAGAIGAVIDWVVGGVSIAVGAVSSLATSFSTELEGAESRPEWQKVGEGIVNTIGKVIESSSTILGNIAKGLVLGLAKSIDKYLPGTFETVKNVVTFVEENPAFIGGGDLQKGQEVAVRRKAAEEQMAEMMKLMENGGKPEGSWYDGILEFFTNPFGSLFPSASGEEEVVGGGLGGNTGAGSGDLDATLATIIQSFTTFKDQVKLIVDEIQARFLQFVTTDLDTDVAEMQTRIDDVLIRISAFKDSVLFHLDATQARWWQLMTTDLDTDMEEMQTRIDEILTRIQGFKDSVWFHLDAVQARWWQLVTTDMDENMNQMGSRVEAFEGLLKILNDTTNKYTTQISGYFSTMKTSIFLSIDAILLKIDALISRMDEIPNYKEIEIHYKETGAVPAGSGDRFGGSHLYRKNYATGGSFISTKAQKFRDRNISEFDKWELVTISPLSDPYNVSDKHSRVDVPIPQVSVPSLPQQTMVSQNRPIMVQGNVTVITMTPDGRELSRIQAPYMFEGYSGEYS